MRFDRRAKVAFVIACLALLGSGLGFRAAVAYFNYYLAKEPVQLREHFATIPRVLGEWQAIGPDSQLPLEMVESLGTDLYLDRNYTDGERGRVMLHIAYYTGMIDLIPHVPDRCMVAGGFRPVELARNLRLHVDKSAWRDDPEAINRKSGQPYPTVTYTHRIHGRPVTVRLPLGEFQARTTEFHRPEQPQDRIFAGFFFIANGHVTHDPLAVRMLAFDKTDKYAYYCKVQFTMAGDSTFGEEQFVDAVSSLLNELLPEIMRCLPDWAEVEARQDVTPRGQQDNATSA